MSKKSATKQQQQQQQEASSKSGAGAGSGTAAVEANGCGQQQASATRKRQKLLGHAQQSQQQPQPAQQQQQQVPEPGKPKEPADEGASLAKSEVENQPGAGASDLAAVAGAQATVNGAPSEAKQQQQNICAACLKPIRERYLLMALDKQWHEDCLKCACCDCRLGEVGSSLFTHSNKLLCRRDFLRIFGRHGNCAACKRSIPPYELVMRANENAYHLDCFSCQNCHYRFCVGDRFHLTQKLKVICILCHAETRSAQASQPNPASIASGADEGLVAAAEL